MERYQRRIADFHRAIIPMPEQSPQRQYSRLMEENMELYLEMADYDGSEKAKDKAAEEAGDLIIRHIGLIESLGRKAETIVDHKIGVMENKYPAEKIVGLQRKGMSWGDAMGQVKREWAA